MKNVNVAVLLLAFFAVATFFFLTTPDAYSPPIATWYNISWHHRAELLVNTSVYSRTDWPVEHEINFTALLDQLSITGTFDNNSIRLIEYTSTGDVHFEQPFQFDEGQGYNESTNAHGTITFQLNGTTSAESIRYFFIYFDIEENGQKSAPTYSTDLTYSWDGQRAEFNNSVFDWNIDTNRGENTSGLYRARGTVSTIFNIGSTGRTADYNEYSNGTYNFTFDLRNNGTISSKPITITFKQSGPEAYWGDITNYTDQGFIEKTYTFYKNLPWFTVEHTFTNLANHSIVRNSTRGGAVAFDVLRILGSGYTVLYNASEPGSRVMSSPPGVATVAMIHVNETGTTNFIADDASGSHDRVGIRLNETTIASNQSISEKVVYYFDQAFFIEDDVEDLKQRHINPVILTQNAPETWQTSALPTINATLVNRGEVVVLGGNANATYDPYSLVGLMNATLDLGTSSTADDIILILNDTGLNGDLLASDEIFSINYSFPTSATVGEWNVSVFSYSNLSQLLNVTSLLFNVTNEYTLNISFDAEFIISTTNISATLTLTNYRNDTFIVGALASCLVNNQPVNNVTDLNNGSYLVDFTAPAVPGLYGFDCNATRFNNTGFAFENFTTESPETDVSVTPTPTSQTITSITQTTSENFTVSVNASNIGNGSANNANITVSVPSGWSVNASTQSCSSINISLFCVRDFEVTVPAQTPPGNVFVNITALWLNPNTSIGTNQTQVNVTILSNPVLTVPESAISEFLSVGEEQTLGNFTVQSTGNDNITNITFDCLSGSICTNFTFEFIPANISDLGPGINQSVLVNVTIPLNQTPDSYAGVVNVSSSNNGWDLVNLSFIIANTTTVSITTNTSTQIVTNIEQNLSQNFTFHANATNTGNASAINTNISVSVPMGWSANATNQSCGKINPTEICTKSFVIVVGAATAPGNYTVNVSVNWTNPNNNVVTNTTSIIVNVTATRLLDVLETTVSDTMVAGTEQTVGNVTAFSAGNENITNVSFSCVSGTVCSTFTVEFIPQNTSIITPGDNQTVLINVTIPGGQASGQYTGVVNVTSADGGNDTFDLDILVSSNRTWVMDRSKCVRVESPEAGQVCEVTVSNTGNTLISFNITPSSANFSSVNVTEFNVSQGESYVFSVDYNISNTSKGYYSTQYLVDALQVDGQPDNQTLNVTLIPFSTPEMIITTQSPLVNNLTSQGVPITILANVTDTSGSGISYTSVNVTRPDGVTDALNMTLVSTSGNLTTWSVLYPQINASNSSNSNGSNVLRGIYYFNITTIDNAAGNLTLQSSFSTEADLVISLFTLQSTYLQGDKGTIFYNVRELNGTPLQETNVTVTVTDSTGNVTFIGSYTTDESGNLPPTQTNLPQFSLASDAPLGQYNVTSVSHWFDNITNTTANDTIANASFTVESQQSGGLFADIETVVVWYPNQVMRFNFLIKDSSGTPVDPDTMELNVKDPAGNLYFTANFTEMTQLSAGVYEYSYAMPTSTATGAYLANLTVSRNTFNTVTIKSFRVASGGPFDVIVDLLESEVFTGDYLDFQLTILNMGEVSQDVLVEYWVTSTDNTTWFYSSESIFSAALSNNTLTRSAFIFTGQPLGFYALNARVTFDATQLPPSANESFLVVQRPIVPPPSSGGGGGGGGTINILSPTPSDPDEPLEVRNLSIISYPRDISLVAGWSRSYTLTVENGGQEDLTGLHLLLVGLPLPWYTITPAEEISLDSGKRQIYTLEFAIPKNAELKDYDLDIFALSNEDIDRKAVKLRVFKSQYDLIIDEVKRLREELQRIESETAFAISVGKNMDIVLDLIDQIKEQLNDAVDNAENERFEEATKNLATAKNLIEKAKELLAKAKLTVEFTLEAIPLLYIVFIIIAIVISNIFIIIFLRGGTKDFRKLMRPRTLSHLNIFKVLEKHAHVHKPVQKSDLEKEKQKLEGVLRLLEKEKQEGVISENVYLELKKINEAKLLAIQKKLKAKG